MRFNLLLSLILFGCQLATAQLETRTYYSDDGSVPREHLVDFTHLKLEVEFEPEIKLVKGKVTEKFTVLRKEIDTLFIDGIKMKYNKVLLDNKEVKYTTTDAGLTFHFDKKLTWGEEHEIYVEYEATPRKGMYFIGWNDTTNQSRKQIWTQGQGIDNRHWVPMWDERNDKLISEMIVTFDEKYEVLSNGKKLKEEKKGNDKKVWHYKISHPHAPYLMMLGIGEYGIEERTSTSGIPMKLYYYPGEEEQIEPTYKYSIEMFDFFEKEFGVDYPWDVYAQIPVQNFMYGAMENTTATIFGDFYLVDERGYLDRNYVRVNAHELAHQWFGDMITARSSAHHWLQESFATHFDMMYQGVAFGDDFFDYTRRLYNLQSLAASKKDYLPLAHSKAGSIRHYPKGAHVLEMLKYVVGRDQFNAAIKYYLEKHAYENVNSKDLLDAFHERLGLSLDWFWEDWVYQGGEPHYNVDFSKKGKKGIFEVQQIHEQNEVVGLFKMPIYFEVHYEDGSVDSRKEWIEEEKSTVTFELGKKKVDYVLFDPNSEILKDVTFKKSTKMLIAQAEKSKNMLDRYDALLALDTLKFKGKNEFLMERFKKEEFHFIKGELIKQLTEEDSDYAEEVILTAIKNPSAEVRKAAILNTRKISKEMEKEYLKLLGDSSYVVIQNALEVLTINNPSNAKEYLALTKGMTGNRSKNIRITWLKIAALIYGDKNYSDEIVNYTSNSYEFLTRMSAFDALRDMDYLNEEAASNLLEGLFNFNSRIRGKSAEMIRYFNEKEEYRKMINKVADSKTWTERQQKA